MVPHTTGILQRLTGEWAALPQPEAISAICGEVSYTGWRDRVLTPVTTVQLFSVADFAWEHRLPASAPSVGLTVHGGRLLSRAGHTPVARL
jgi:FAD/FMN-containing dehydrogenase